jgi:hypothetical protein
MKRFLLLILPLFFIATLYSNEAKPIACDVLFYLQNAGETYPFISVIENLEKKQISYKVLVTATAQEILQKEESISKNLLLLPELALENIDNNWEGDKTLPTETIKKICSLIKPKLVITGVAFDLQGQVLEEYSKKGVETWAFWDNFNATGDNPYFTMAHRVIKKANKLLLSSNTLSNDISFFYWKDENKKILGHPSLELCTKKYNSVDSTSIKKALNIKKDKFIVTYMGGYGKEYEEGFELFLYILDKMQSDFSYLIVPHPKTDGSYEKKAINDRFGYSKRIQVLTPNGDISTPEAIVISDIVLCHQSTVGIQALFANKKVIYVVPKNQKFTNFAIDKNISKKIFDISSFVEAIYLSPPEPVDIYTLIGMPRNSAKLFVKEIEQYLNK